MPPGVPSALILIRLSAAVGAAGFGVALTGCSSISGPAVRLIADASDEGLPAFRIETPAATYLLEKTGGGLSSLLDREGRDWLSFHPVPDSGAGGEYRGFPNAVHQQAGNYFHPKNRGTDPCTLTVVRVEPARVTIAAAADNGLWAATYDFFATHCTFTMTKMPPGKKYWVLYEGTPGGEFDPNDWWLTSALATPRPVTERHVGDIPAPEWIAFGDQRSARALLLLHHEDDAHPDDFYAMEGKMTVFGFGRRRVAKFLDAVPQRVSIGLVESTEHAALGRAAAAWMTAAP